ncbi:hypothetical protein SISNIDRAFT_464803 [Sistotremastrum niveocremeum HHB9708]|uniref:Uncharacterized protein n=1 Tax=Sistotremastrum niveocremeum HHB9708 TaxID=1314777 RepID=A0A164WLB7_9AGAM|nr:hypothetical protein SISNIDRAFT_464803 [Sistotremastrum niveocremeum HHB9708]
MPPSTTCLAPYNEYSISSRTFCNHSPPHVFAPTSFGSRALFVLCNYVERWEESKCHTYIDFVNLFNEIERIGGYAYQRGGISMPCITEFFLASLGYRRQSFVLNWTQSELSPDFTNIFMKRLVFEAAIKTFPPLPPIGADYGEPVVYHRMPSNPEISPEQARCLRRNVAFYFAEATTRPIIDLSCLIYLRDQLLLAIDQADCYTPDPPAIPHLITDDDSESTLYSPESEDSDSSSSISAIDADPVPDLYRPSSPTPSNDGPIYPITPSNTPIPAFFTEAHIRDDLNPSFLSVEDDEVDQFVRIRDGDGWRFVLSSIYFGDDVINLD